MNVIDRQVYGWPNQISLPLGSDGFLATGVVKTSTQDRMHSIIRERGPSSSLREKSLCMDDRGFSIKVVRNNQSFELWGKYERATDAHVVADDPIRTPIVSIELKAAYAHVHDEYTDAVSVSEFSRFAPEILNLLVQADRSGRILWHGQLQRHFH